jgi:hypothetical protein
MRRSWLSLVIVVCSGAFADALPPTEDVVKQPPFTAGKAGVYAPVEGAQGERREQLMKRLASNPYPKSGPARYIAQALGSYWIGDSVAGDKAIEELRNVANAGVGKEENRFHWSAFHLTRIVSLFGSKGVYAPGRMGDGTEMVAKELLWTWLQPRGRLILADPDKDWWLWGSENHHLQAWFGMWGALSLFAQDPEYANKRFSDGSSVPELKKAFDDYFKRWIRHRATRGMFVESNSPTYAKYSISGFYNFVDFADDAELRRLASQFLDLYWAQWSLEQIDGIRGGSRHRSYAGASSILDGSSSNVAWFHFGIGERSAHPAVLCTATSSYTPPPLVHQIAHQRPTLGAYEIISRLPGLANPEEPDICNYVDEPDYPLFRAGGVYNLDPLCRSMLRTTYATPEFILGATMVPALSKEAWTAISSQNRWEGVVFAGNESPRIFIQPRKPARGSVYNTQWSVMKRGVLLIQQLSSAKSARDQAIWFSQGLQIKERDGWIFVEADHAYAAVKIVDGCWQWETDAPEFWRQANFQPDLGQWLIPEQALSPIVLEVVPKHAYASLAGFQDAILGNAIDADENSISYTSSYYNSTLRLFTDYSQLPQIDGETVDFAHGSCFSGGVLEGAFGSDAVQLNAFGQTHEFSFR